MSLKASTILTRTISGGHGFICVAAAKLNQEKTAHGTNVRNEVKQVAAAWHGREGVHRG
jgi:hypothetical protein